MIISEANTWALAFLEFIWRSHAFGITWGLILFFSSRSILVPEHILGVDISCTWSVGWRREAGLKTSVRFHELYW